MRVLRVTGVLVACLALAAAGKVPQNVLASLVAGGASGSPTNAPEKIDKAPEKPEAAPEKTEAAPEKPEAAPEKLEAALEKLEGALEQLEAAQEKPVAAQEQPAAAQEKPAAAPEKLEKESGKADVAPLRVEAAPENVEKVPEIRVKAAVEAPEKISESHEKTPETPKEESLQGDSAKSEAPVNYSGTQLWRVDATNKPDSLKSLLETSDLKTWLSNETVADVVVQLDKSKEMEALLREQGLSYTVSIQDLQAAINDANPQLTEEELELQGRKGHRMTWNHYHRAQDIYGFLDYVAQTYPDFCSVQTIGNSVEGRPLKVLKIAGRPGSPAMWVDGGIHAREWITPASVTYLINELVENRASYESWLSKVDLHILPLVNPDGYEHTHVGDRLWRKNRRSTGGFAQCSGTDLNRNWGYKWGGEGASNSPCRETYRGSGPFSEPETNAVQRHIMSIGNLKGYLTFHSYGQYILYPWGYGRFVPPDHADLQRVGQKMATAMKATSGLPYRVGPSGATLYPASGGSDDWAKGTANIKYPYTIELRDTGTHGFVLPVNHIKSSGKEAVAAVETLAKEISLPTAVTE